MVDWLAIKTEYITTDTSYRKLAEKYGVPKNRIAEHGKREDWAGLRGQHQDKTLTKTVEKISTAQARRAAKVDALADKLLLKLEQAIDELDLNVTTHKIKMEQGNTEKTSTYRMVEPGGVVDRAGLRQLTAALKELQEIKGEMSELSRREREARIQKIEAEVQAAKDDAAPVEFTVCLEGELAEYAD